MAFVRVTDPELAAELYSNGLMYYTSPHQHRATPRKCSGQWKSCDIAYEIKHGEIGYCLYVYMEE